MMVDRVWTCITGSIIGLAAIATTAVYAFPEPCCVNYYTWSKAECAGPTVKVCLDDPLTGLYQSGWRERSGSRLERCCWTYSNGQFHAGCTSPGDGWVRLPSTEDGKCCWFMGNVQKECTGDTVANCSGDPCAH